MLSAEKTFYKENLQYLGSVENNKSLLQLQARSVWQNTPRRFVGYLHYLSLGERITNTQ